MVLYLSSFVSTIFMKKLNKRLGRKKVFTIGYEMYLSTTGPPTSPISVCSTTYVHYAEIVIRLYVFECLPLDIVSNVNV
jgi:Na+/melibiose symporter-like transporter